MQSRWRRSLSCWASLAALTLLRSACAEKQSPQQLLEQAEARLAANDAAGAQRLLGDALTQAPNDARLHIALARADLASGHAAAAEGSIERAMALGAPKEELPAISRACCWRKVSRSAWSIWATSASGRSLVD